MLYVKLNEQINGLIHLIIITELLLATGKFIGSHGTVQYMLAVKTTVAKSAQIVTASKSTGMEQNINQR